MRMYKTDYQNRKVISHIIDIFYPQKGIMRYKYEIQLVRLSLSYNIQELIKYAVMKSYSNLL